MAQLSEADLQADPIAQFRSWFAGASELALPEAAALATATADGAPAVRMVLVKQVDERGFVFFTNYESRKADELAANPRAALLFYWEPLGRQIRIEGAVERASAEESAAYVRNRPRASQLSAMASPQSKVVESRMALEAMVAELAARYGDGELPIPDNWGGYRVVAERFEFWQRRDDRLHDRLVYSREGTGWAVARLAP